MAFSIMNARQKQRFKEEFEIDIAYSVPGLGRFRCNVFQQRGTVGLVLRVIPARILTHPRADAAAGARADLRGAARPGAVHRHHRLRQVDHAGGDDRLHQQPRAPSTSSPSRTRSSSCTATRSRSSTSARSTSTPAPSRPRCAPALRQDPDVILVGEMRDYETIETALLAAETGHLVLLDAAHPRRHRDDQPHHLGLPAAPPEADPHPARRRCSRR